MSIGLLVGVGFTPTPREFEALLASGALDASGRQYVTLELTAKEASNRAYLRSLFQGACAQQNWPQGVSLVDHLEVNEETRDGKKFLIAQPASTESSDKDPIASTRPGRRFSVAGIIVGVLLLLLAIPALVPSGDPTLAPTGLVSGILLLARSFLLPLRFWQGLLTVLGGFFIGGFFGALLLRTSVGLSFEPGSLVLLALGAVLAWAGFRHASRAPQQRSPKTA